MRKEVHAASKKAPQLAVSLHQARFHVRVRDSTVLSDHGVSEEEVESTNSLMQSADIMNEIKTRVLPR